MYNILEARIEYKNRKLHRVTVLVEISRGDIRAIYCCPEMSAGYDTINPDEPINEALMQRVAGYGCQISLLSMNKVFPGWLRKLGYKIGS